MTLLCRCGELLTQIEDIVEHWKKHFDELLNLINMSSVEEAESDDLGLATEAIKKLFSCKMPVMGEIFPKKLKALDIIWLSWLTRLYNLTWRSGDSICEVTGWVVVSIFDKVNRRECSNY